MKRWGKCFRFRDRQIRRPQERKECGRAKEQQEGQDGGGRESKEQDRGEAGAGSLMEGCTGFLRIWDFVPGAMGSHCRVSNRDRLHVHFDKNILMAVWGLAWQEVRVVQGDYLEHYYRSLG